MPRKVTLQDIANEMGLSRNTVSKAINGTGIIADSTRDAIIRKAQEMGYKLFSIPSAAKDNDTELSSSKELVLLTGSALGGSHFSTRMLDEMQLEASRMGYGFTMYRVLPQERESCRLPANFDIKRAAGIFCLEMFDIPYSQMLCSLEVPVVFIDTAVAFDQKPLEADVLLMENRNCIYRFIHQMKERGKNEIAFVGEAMHCMSFYERYDAYMSAMRLFNLPVKSEWCLTGSSSGMKYPSHDEYVSYLTEEMGKWKNIPSVIICANDFVAMDVIQVLKKMGITSPKDLYLCGFDDAPESKIITPALTTIHIHARAMGKSAINMLFSRLKNPDLPYRTAYVESSLVYRESTGD